MADPNSCQGQTFMGTVKSYAPQKGYGFITSDKIRGDIFFFHRNLPKHIVDGISMGNDSIKFQECAFTLEINEEGKPTASDVKLFKAPASTGKGKGEGKAMKGGKGGAKGGKDGATKGKGKPPMGSWDAGYDAGGWGGEESYGPPKGKSKGKGKGKPTAAARPPRTRADNGTPMCEGRIEAKMKSFSCDSRWGFANCEPSVGEYGDIFVHLNNIDPSIAGTINALRIGDAIEFNLENVEGKAVAKKVTIVPVDPSTYSGQWMKGVVTSYSAETGSGAINCPRVWGDIWFSTDDMPPSMKQGTLGREIVFNLVSSQEGAQAQLVTPIDTMEHWEAQEYSGYIVDRLKAEGFVDDTAALALKNQDPFEFVGLLPDLQFYTAENPSSFILGALSRQRGERSGGRSKVGGKAKGPKGEQKGGYKGKARYEPY